MRIIIFSDFNYIPVVQNLIHSLDAIYGDCDLTFYMVGFSKKNCLQPQNLRIEYKPFLKPLEAPNLNFIKPSILLKSLKDYPSENDFLFLDSDLTVGKRFNPSVIFSELQDFPSSPFGPFESPYTYRTFENGRVENYTPDLLMQYFNVGEKTMRYVQNCIIAYSRKHQDFILEWESISLNKFLLKEHWRYFSFQDETAYNVLLWKYGCTQNLGHLFVNTHKYSTYKLVEESDEVRGNVDENPYEYCHDSSKIMLYHGTKDPSENIKIQKYIYENYTGNPGATSYSS
jgi:hypothetical protein